MSRRPAVRPLAGLVLLVGLLTGCVTPAEEPAPVATERPSAEQRAPERDTTGNVTVTESSVILGDPDAAERVHVYQDLSCPHCKTLHEEMGADVETWAGGSDVAVELTVVDYLGPRTAHAFSTRGATLLALVADVDPAAWPAVHQALLDMQPTSTTADVTDEEILAAARDAGADLPSDLAPLEQLGYSGWVDDVTAQAAAAGISYIPQVWVDGALVEGASHDETAALTRQAVAD